MAESQAGEVDVLEGPGRSAFDILTQGESDIPEWLRYRKVVDLGLEPILASRYTSKEFFQKEVDKVWLKTWQFACLEDEIPEVGDTHIFDLVGRSLLIVRQPDRSIKAFHNVCRHRGRRLADKAQCVNKIRCPYHGFTWNIDGSFKHNPFGWDFPQIDESDFPLPEARVEVWSGFVFVNFDQDAEPLLPLLGNLPRHMEYWRLQDCYKAAHVAKIAPANWKVALEAFIEGHHLLATHPKMLPLMACDKVQYDLISDHVTRFIGPQIVTGDLWPGDRPSDQDLVDMILKMGSRSAGDAEQPPSKLEPGQTARSYVAGMRRKALEAETGYDFSDSCDADFLDSISYDIFPNFHPWGGLQPKIFYRFRPNGLNHEECILEVMLFKIAPKNQPKPPPAKLHFLGEDEPWAAATELNYLAAVFDEDQSNMEPTQQGLRSLGETGVVQFSRYQEMRCRHLHQMIDEYIEK